MRKDIQFLRELLDANSKMSPSNNALLKELDVYKTRCEELTQVVEDFKSKMNLLVDNNNNKKIKELEDENDKLRRNSDSSGVSMRLQTEVDRLNTS